VKCAVAIDLGSEVIAEIMQAWLPDEWRPHVAAVGHNRFGDVVGMVRDVQPALLIIHSNLLIAAPEGAIAACAAVSPSTRYLIMTAWQQEHIEALHKSYEALHIAIQTLRMPFNREQLNAAVKAALA